jgi:hypothetical protein
MQQILAEILKRRSKPEEVVIGVIIPSMCLVLYMVFGSALGDSGPGQLIFVLVFMSIAPIMSSNTILGALALGALFFPLVKFIPSPYLRLAVALHFTGWLYLGFMSAGTMAI